MKRPVWLFSLDSEQFNAPPTTTGALVACYKKYGSRFDQHDFELVHFQQAAEVADWKHRWLSLYRDQAVRSLEAGQRPVAAFSFYTWNAAPFLDLVSFLKKDLPELLVIAGGPHVQQAEDYLGEDPVDLIVLGEGEFTFCDLMDADNPFSPDIPGIAYLDEAGKMQQTPARKRTTRLDDLPSALDVVPLANSNGEPLYTSISYETARGCPFTCAFCEWGTGAIGTKMLQFSLERIGEDLNRIVASGIKDIWFADSNFGALKEDLEKTHILIELKKKTGLPSSFATSWSKNHSPKVQQIVRLLHENQLLPHYQLALQTLTPEALRLSNRQNMQANKFEPIAQQLSAEGIPITAELIWGLPGDNLADFTRNLDYLLSIFPNINIFGYTLLPGTEFYEKRQQYRIEALPVAGYGKALGEYVVACHSYTRDEGYAGYYLITAHILFVHGHILPLTTRYLALSGITSASDFLVSMLDAMIEGSRTLFENTAFSDAIHTYENRNRLYLQWLENLAVTQTALKKAAIDVLAQKGVNETETGRVLQVLEMDMLLCPRVSKTTIHQQLGFDGHCIVETLSGMQLPGIDTFAPCESEVTIEHSGGVGSFLKDADGGSWIKGRLVDNPPLPVAENLIASSALQPI